MPLLGLALLCFSIPMMFFYGLFNPPTTLKNVEKVHYCVKEYIPAGSKIKTNCSVDLTDGKTVWVAYEDKFSTEIEEQFVFGYYFYKGVDE